MNFEKIFFNAPEKINVPPIFFIKTDFFSLVGEIKDYFGHINEHGSVYLIKDGVLCYLSEISNLPANTKIYSVEFLSLPSEKETETPKQQQQTKFTEILGLEPKKITIEF